MTPDDLEGRLREVLHREAERITPHERRTEILAMAHHETAQVEPQRRWLIPAAAAASVVLLGAVVWGVSSSGGSQPVTLAATHAVTSPPAAAATAAPTARPSQAPAPLAVPKPSPATTPNGSAAGASTQVMLPAYFVGAITATGDQFGLYREFVQTAVPTAATPAQTVKAAVAVAMNAAPLASVEPYLQPWSGTAVTNVTVTPSLITITLSGPGASGFSAAQTKLAVQELVWTAQAALGHGAVPVKFVVANGPPMLFGTYPTAQTYNRPAPDLQYQVLAPIWITSPVRNQVFPAGGLSHPSHATVVATGQSCAFEGTTQWQLKLNGTVIRSGAATASSGCPTRGTWQVGLGALTAGNYTFAMFEVSMQNGQVVAETSKPFTVR
jgi:hypothetical protein